MLVNSSTLALAAIVHECAVLRLLLAEHAAIVRLDFVCVALVVVIVVRSRLAAVLVITVTELEQVGRVVLLIIWLLGLGLWLGPLDLVVARLLLLRLGLLLLIEPAVLGDFFLVELVVVLGDRVDLLVAAVVIDTTVLDCIILEVLVIAAEIVHIDVDRTLRPLSGLLRLVLFIILPTPEQQRAPWAFHPLHDVAELRLRRLSGGFRLLLSD